MRTRLLLALVALLVPLAACSGDDDAPGATGSAPEPSPTP